MNRYLLKFRMLLTGGDSRKRAELLRNTREFHAFGEHCLWQPMQIPSEPFLVSIGNNVNVAANVTFATHDVINSILIYIHQKSQTKCPTNGMYLGPIEVGDNVMIGANSIILYNTHIGSNVIVAAGSVVTRDIPSGTIVGGNPAKVIGSFDALLEKRASMNPLTPDNLAGRKAIEDFFWN